MRRYDELEKLERIRVLAGAARSHASSRNRMMGRNVSLPRVTIINKPLTQEEEEEIEAYMRWRIT